MDNNIFYNGTKLINIKDCNGKKPEIYILDGNRSSGKTTFFSRWFVNRFKKYNELFMLVYRYKNELSEVETKFFSDIQGLFFPNDIMSSQVCDKGLYIELYLNDKLCGYAVALNMANKLKKCSHIFTGVQRMLFDEFQVADSEYCVDEVNKFVTLHTSVARGKGQSVRYCPVFMISNHLSSLNPYYKLFDCVNKADSLTNGFIRGDGFVIEKNMNNKVADLQKQSAFNRACSKSQAVVHTVDNIGLSDNKTFVQEITSKHNKYICNIIVDGVTIALKQVNDVRGVRYYFTDKIDGRMNTRFVINTNDHDDTTLLVGKNYEFMRQLRMCFDCGYIRFSDMQTKDYAMHFLLLSVPH